jgi:signal transduction histidine kinase/FixJ family two-component response regulator
MQPRPERLFDHREFPVLYVDDEPENLRIFELMFRREFSILTASSAEEGLEVINREPVALVLSDHRMPGMTGVEFLSRVHEIEPKTVRILVTAYGDAGTLQTAINSGAIYRFVPKPWSPEDMRLTLRRGIEVFALDRERAQLLRELTLLNRVSKAMNQELDLKRLLGLLLEAVTEEFGYDAAGVLFFDPQQRDLEWMAFAPSDRSIESILSDLELNEEMAPGFVGSLRDGNSQVLSIDQALDLEGPVKRWVTEVAAEETLVIPLVGQKGTIGAMTVDNRRGGRRFNTDDRTLLEGLAHQAVIAIQNARLVEDLRRSREQIQRVDRLGTLGTLAAGLAHEINNPLVSIHTFLSMAPDKRSEDDEEFWGSYHQLACREVDRIRGLVNTMRRLGRDSGRTVPGESFDPGDMAAEVIKLLERESGRANVGLRLDRDPEAPKLHAIRDHIHQVCMNLLLNALHASPTGGEVLTRIRTEAGDGDERFVCIEVTDSGPGIPEEDIERIFDPFFTTKGPDQGSGLGLMICYRIVTDHGGTLEVHSQEGSGATFCVRLPMTGDAGAGAARATD